MSYNKNYKLNSSITHSLKKKLKLAPINKYNKHKEIVYKLNLKNDGLMLNDNHETERIKKLIYNGGQEDFMNPTKLYKSIEQVKSFFPEVKILLDKTKKKTIENIIYKRFKNQDYEDLLKNKIKEISLEKEKLDMWINKYIDDLHKNEYNIAGNQVSITTLVETDLKNTNNDNQSSIDKRYMRRRSSHIGDPLKRKIKTEKKEKDKEMMTLLARSRTDDKIKNINLKIGKLKREKSEILKKINNVEKQKDILRNKKQSVIQELYRHYLDILKTGKDTRNEGLSWVIKEIFLLGKKVLTSYFPEYLDHLGKTFLFKQAKIGLNMDVINAEINMIKQQLYEKGIFNRSTIENNDNLNCSDINNFNTLNNDSKYESIKSERNKINNNEHFKNISSLDKKYTLDITNHKNRYFIKKIKFNNSRNKLSLNHHNNFGKNDNIISNIKDSFNITKTKINSNTKYNNDIKDSNLTRYNTINIYGEREKKKLILTDNNIPDVIRLTDLEEYIEQKNSESIIKNYNLGKLIEEFNNLNKQLNEMKKKHEIMKKKEMDRIFNEYLTNNYYQKYGVEKNVVLSALIGEDNINNELNKQIKRARKYFKQANSISFGNRHTRKKSYKFDKSQLLKLRNLIGANFLGGLY